jgi:hypothetical protein
MRVKIMISYPTLNSRQFRPFADKHESSIGALFHDMSECADGSSMVLEVVEARNLKDNEVASFYANLPTKCQALAIIIDNGRQRNAIVDYADPAGGNPFVVNQRAADRVADADNPIASLKQKPVGEYSLGPAIVRKPPPMLREQHWRPAIKQSRSQAVYERRVLVRMQQVDTLTPKKSSQAH